MKCRGMKFRDEDDAHDYFAQRELDDAVDAKKHAAGISKEELALQDARIEGQRAGANGTRASCNPWQAGTPEHDAWERGRASAEVARLTGTR